MTQVRALGFLGFLSLCAPSCDTNGELLQPIGTEATPQTPLISLPPEQQHKGGPAAEGCGCADVSAIIVGTWDVINHGLGRTGQVTFNTDGTYTVDNGTYDAGGSAHGRSAGSYRTIPGGAIAFAYQGYPSISRIAVVRTANAKHIVHYVLGHTHSYEELTRTR